MKKDYKKIIISIFIFFIVLLLSVCIIVANNSSQKINFEIDKEKIYYEIKYFDSQIIYMINLLNNIENTNDFYIDWIELKNQTNNLYVYWNSVILDFNYFDIEKTYLTDFGKDLDNLSIAIKNNNKENTLKNLLELYKRIIIYSELLNDNFYHSILIIKYNLIISYSIVEKDNWTLTHEYIMKASENITNLLNSMENNKYNQYNINQAYVAVKELENLINIKDINVFYIKYKNAMNNIYKIKIGEA